LPFTSNLQLATAKATSSKVQLCGVPSATFILSENVSFKITLLCTTSNRQNHYGNLPDVKPFFRQKTLNTALHLVGFPSSEAKG
jgi:hypothetical protein